MFDVHVAAEGDSTRVTQAIFGPSPYISKLMGLVFDMDKTIGGKFEQGLAELKALAERSKEDSNALHVDGLVIPVPKNWGLLSHCQEGKSFDYVSTMTRERFTHHIL